MAKYLPMSLANEMNRRRTDNFRLPTYEMPKVYDSFRYKTRVNESNIGKVRFMSDYTLFPK